MINTLRHPCVQARAVEAEEFDKAETLNHSMELFCQQAQVAKSLAAAKVTAWAQLQAQKREATDAILKSLQASTSTLTKLKHQQAAQLSAFQTEQNTKFGQRVRAWSGRELAPST